MDKLLACLHAKVLAAQIAFSQGIPLTWTIALFHFVHPHVKLSHCYFSTLILKFQPGKKKY